jgi:uncharacterized protein involved in type VI secretion and phage assembly
MLEEGLLNIIRREVDRAVNRRKHKRYGVIDGYDPEKHAAKVKFQPEGTISGWLALSSVWSGNNFGLFTPPNKGDQVCVSYEDGDMETAVISHRYWNDVDKPMNVPAGEAWMHHKEGQGFKMQNDKSMSLIGQASTKQLFDPSGKVITTIPNSSQRAEFKRNAGDTVKRVMLEDGSFSNVLRATTS